VVDTLLKTQLEISLPIL